MPISKKAYYRALLFNEYSKNMYDNVFFKKKIV